MATIVQDNITFNNVKDTTVSVGGVVAVRGAQGVDPEFGGVINAIDIDWNAADLGKEVEANLDGTPSEGNSAEINTTYELIYQ